MGGIRRWLYCECLNSQVTKGPGGSAAHLSPGNACDAASPHGGVQAVGPAAKR
jgi:hypothetical protein